jgi:hypothetical protein
MSCQRKLNHYCKSFLADIIIVYHFVTFKTLSVERNITDYGIASKVFALFIN